MVLVYPFDFFRHIISSSAAALHTVWNLEFGVRILRKLIHRGLMTCACNLDSDHVQAVQAVQADALSEGEASDEAAAALAKSKFRARPLFLSQHLLGWPAHRPRSYIVCTKDDAVVLCGDGINAIKSLFRKPNLPAMAMTFYCAPKAGPGRAASGHKAQGTSDLCDS